MIGLSNSSLMYKNVLWANSVRHGYRKAKINRIRDHRRNAVRAKASEHLYPERCHGLVDKTGKPFMYMMMTHDEAKRRNKQTELIGYRWTLCTPTNQKEIKTK